MKKTAVSSGIQNTDNYEKHSSRHPLIRYAINNFYSTMYSLISDVVPLRRILDAGCGEGYTLKRMEDAGIGKIRIGIDSSRDAIALGKQLHPSADIRFGDVYTMPFYKQSFDLVTCTEVLEHLQNPAVALKEFKRVSRKYILLSVPNEPWFCAANMVRGAYVHRFGRNYEHVNFWTVRSFMRLLEKNGLRVLSMRLPFPWTMVLAEV